ncbi:MAG TPA: hypothetical protein PLS87_08740 [Ferruginibacter sp.]|nr:hypothetical protein [Ferruginibacter sp.]HRO96895.1 hypothetical protein [Ferruginibacter sp.]HRP49993.1 hypothetical protein [Ferruginibacter sp.]
MKQITNMHELQEAIREMELVQLHRKQALLKQIDITKQSFKPINLIKSTLRDFAGDKNSRHTLLQTAAGIGLGFLTKNMVTGKSASAAKNLLGGLVESGVQNLTGSETIKAYLKAIYKNLFAKKHKDPASTAGDAID